MSVPQARENARGGRIKTATEITRLSFDFAPRLAAGVTIIAVATVTGFTGTLVQGATAIAADGVTATVIATGGTAGTAYTIRVGCTTSDAQVVELEGILNVVA